MIETDLDILEGAAFTWLVDLKDAAGETLPQAGFRLYGAACCTGEAPRAFAVTVEGEVATVRMPGLPLADYPWSYQLLAVEVESKVEWLIAAGSVNLTARNAGAGLKLDPGLCRASAVLDKVTQRATLVIGDNMASIAENARAAAQHSREARASEEAAAGSATAAAGSATAAADSATAAGNQAQAAAGSATAAAGSATAAGNQAQAAAGSAGAAAGSATAAADSATAAGNQAQAAAGSATAAAGSAATAGAAAGRAADSEREAGEHAELAEEHATEAAGSHRDAEAAKDAAAVHVAEARRVKEAMQGEQAAFLAHLQDENHHLTAGEKAGLQRLLSDFPAVDPDHPSAPLEPPLPDEAIPHAKIKEYFALHAQPGASAAPSAVYLSRVPWARKDPDSGAWMNNACAVDEAVFGAARKLMDNAGLQHACSTDTIEGADDYNGKLWAFFSGRGNYVTDSHGVKHLSAIEGQVVNGVSFDEAKPVCAFGTAFWFICKLERWQDPETGAWTTHDGTAEGIPLYQLWGISPRRWEDLDAGRQAELAAHGITADDLHLWCECRQWDEAEGKAVERPYWIHSAYCGGFEVQPDGTTIMTSKPGLPLYNNLSHNTLNGLYGNRPGFGGSAVVNAFGMIFDIVKNATKNSQSIHSGNASNNNSAVKASQSTAQPDYLFPIASRGNFRVGCSVWLWQTAGSSAGGTTYRRSQTVQIGRIDAIETRRLTLADGSSAESLCLVIDPGTVEPFFVRTGADNAAAIAATKELTDQGIYAACFATQGMALTGETDRVIGKHDGSRTSLTDSKHPYRVMHTEYLPGIFLCAADVVAVRGTGAVDVEIDGVVSIPTSAQYVILQAGFGVTRRTSGSLQQYLDSGYVPVGLSPTTAGYVLNVQVSPSGVAYPVATGGTGSGSSTGHADNTWTGASPAESLIGGGLSDGAGCGSACLALCYGLSTAFWFIGARD